jgi:hypothetical protein
VDITRPHLLVALYIELGISSHMCCESRSRRFKTVLIKSDIVGAYSTLNKSACRIVHYGVGIKKDILNTLKWP